MTKIERVRNKVAENKKLRDSVNSLYENVDEFISECSDYIKACSEGRAMCLIGSVSRSGQSRTMCFKYTVKSRYKINRFYNTNKLFLALGYNLKRNSDFFRVDGCGMDMVFKTHYDVMSEMRSIGLISKAKCDKLRQQTPVTLN